VCEQRTLSGPATKGRGCDLERILLIHADPPTKDELTFLLQHSGFQVSTAADYHQSLAEIFTKEPDLIVMAEAVARINGDEPCIGIREVYGGPIIILGRHRKKLAGLPFLAAGADTYIPSPLDRRFLLAWVRSLLRRRDLQRLSKMDTRLRQPKDAFIRGNRAWPAEDGSGMFVENVHLVYAIDTTRVGRFVLVANENIVCVTLED
jgi:DNA-binding response OmpR family regulator